MAWFDATQHDPATGSAQWPLGRHIVAVRKSERTAVKDKPHDGMLVLHCEVLDGPHKGGVYPYRLNLWNSNPQASEIAHKQLSAVCHVTGVYQLNAQGPGQDCMELFGKPFGVIVEPQTDPKYTQVVGVTDTNGNPPSRQASPPPSQQPQPGWQPNASAPPAGAGNPAAQPSWQPGAPAAPNGAAPPWQAGGPAPGPQQGAPSWAAQPPTGQPSWQR